MQSNRPLQQLKIFTKPHDNQRVSSLEESALRSFASTHNGLFTPTDQENEVLMVIKNSASDVANDIKTDIEALLLHIAYGEQTEAEKIIDASPHLLMMSGTVVNYSLQTIIDMTPAQCAFGGDDEVMCNMLKQKMSAYYQKVHNNHEPGEAEFLRQIHEKFSKDAEKELREMAEFDKLMNQLVAAISDPEANIQNELNHVPNASHLRNVLDSFRVQFAPGEVRAGKHFNVQFLLTAITIYDAKYEAWDDNQRRLFWRQVVGYLERLLPVSYVQAGCHGIEEYILNGYPLIRQLTSNWDDHKTPYYPLDANPADRLGFNHAIYFGKVPAMAHCGQSDYFLRNGRGAGRAIEKLYRRKTEKLQQNLELAQFSVERFQRGQRSLKNIMYPHRNHSSNFNGF